MVSRKVRNPNSLPWRFLERVRRYATLVTEDLQLIDDKISLLSLHLMKCDSKDRFREEFESIKSQVTMGNAHLELWKGLSERLDSDPRRLALNVSPAFFGMTLEAHLNTAILHAARIFDTHPDSINMNKIIERAKSHSASLSPSAQASLTQSMALADLNLPKLKSGLEAVRTRRNKTLAHLDPQVVSRPEVVIKKSKLTVAELQNIFIVAWEILNGISALYWNFSFSDKLIGVDDYVMAVSYIEDAKKRQREQYEAEFGPLQDSWD